VVSVVTAATVDSRVTVGIPVVGFQVTADIPAVGSQVTLGTVVSVATVGTAD
jgi:hypothetical protein